MRFMERRREGSLKPVEAVGLALAALLPSYFNARSTFSFEPDRMTLLRVLAVVLVTAWLLEGATRRFRLTPIRLAVGGWLAWQVVATLASVDVGQSLWGSEERAGGLLTAAAWAALALCLPAALAAEGAIHRLVVASSLGSAPVALYALAQWAGWDPVRVAAAPAQPAPAIVSTLGNPVFLGGYLAMVLPLTLWLAWGAKRKAAPLALAFLQGAALIVTEARGPRLGLAAGGVTALLLAGVVSRRRQWVRGALAALAVGVALLLASGLPLGGAAEGLRRLPYFGRLVGLWSGTTAAQRFLIWEGAARLTAYDLPRALLGYGPETLNLTYARVYPPRLAEYEPDGYVRLPDRAHNLAWDAVTEGGLGGLVAILALWGAAVGVGLERLNVLRPDNRAGFILTVAGAGTAGAGAASALARHAGAAGLGLGLGLWLGMVGWLGARGLRGARASATLSREQGLLIALLTALGAHFVDVQFGFATAATGSLFWLCLAMLDAHTSAEREGRDGLPSPAKGRTRAGKTSAQEAAREGWPWLAGLALLAFGFGLTSSGGLAALPLLALAWLLLALGCWAMTGRLDLGWWVMAGLAPLTLALLATLAAKAGAWGSLVSLLLFYLGVLAGLAMPFVALGPSGEGGRNPYRLRRGGWLAVGCLALLIPLRLNTADVLHKAGVLAARGGDAAEGLRWVTRALVWNPGSDVFRYSLARLLAFQAQTPGLPSDRAQALWQQGAQELERGWEARPRAVAYAGWLAEHYRLWAEVDDPDAHLATAEAFYRKGLEAFPDNVEWWARLGDVLRRRGEYQAAEAALASALSRAPRYYPAHLGQGDLLREQGESARALAAYRQAVSVAPWAPETHLALAQALADEGQRDEALAEARIALQLAAAHPARSAAADLIAALEGGDGR